MKSILPSLLCLIGIAFASCQKEVSYEVAAPTYPRDTTGNGGGSGGGGNGGGGGGGSSSGYYIKGKKNGTAFNFTVFPMATIMSVAGTQMVSINANAAMPTTSLESVGISINFSNGATLATTTYSEDDGSLDHIVAGAYNPNSMTITWGAGLTANSAKPLKVIITAKSSTEISGTFEGAFYKEDLTAGTISQTDYITFTGCEFKVKVQ